MSDHALLALFQLLHQQEQFEEVECKVVGKDVQQAVQSRYPFSFGPNHLFSLEQMDELAQIHHQQAFSSAWQMMIGIRIFVILQTLFNGILSMSEEVETEVECEAEVELDSTSTTLEIL